MPTLRLSSKVVACAGLALALAACGDPGGGGVFGNSGSGGSGDGGGEGSTRSSGPGGKSSANATGTGAGGPGATSTTTTTTTATGNPVSATSTTTTASSGGCFPGEEYACLSGTQCIPTEWQCDGFGDCADGSDEPPLNFACGTVVSSVASSSASTGGCAVPCGEDGVECVLPTDICDGQDDCANDSDERGCEAGTWTCPENYYGAGDGCDCGCGTRDPDCIAADASVCEYCGDGSCALECDQIRADQNWRCVENDG